MDKFKILLDLIGYLSLLNVRCNNLLFTSKLNELIAHFIQTEESTWYTNRFYSDIDY